MNLKCTIDFEALSKTYHLEKLNFKSTDLFEISRKYLPDTEKDFLDKPIWLLKNRKCTADIILEKGIKDADSLYRYLKTNN